MRGSFTKLRGCYCTATTAAAAVVAAAAAVVAHNPPAPGPGPSIPAVTVVATTVVVTGMSVRIRVFGEPGSGGVARAIGHGGKTAGAATAAASAF